MKLTARLLGESDPNPSHIFYITKNLAARLNYFAEMDIEDYGDEGGESSCGYFRSVITDWMNYAKKLLKGNRGALGALSNIKISLRNHMHYETSSCIYNIAEPWARFLRGDESLPQLVFDPYKGGAHGLYVVMYDDIQAMSLSGDIMNFDQPHEEIWDGSTFLDKL